MPLPIVANAVALVAALAWLASLTLPSSQAVRVRNAFLLRRGGEDDFRWAPDALPEGFAAETATPPGELAQAVADASIANIADEWTRARALTGLLVGHAREDAPIRADLATTWQGIVAGGGYCADYVRVYLAATRAAGLFARQWSFSFDGFGGHGHTVVEVWLPKRRRWAFLDVHNNVYAEDPATGDPLDVDGLRAALRERTAPIAFRQAASGRLGWPHFDKLEAYYRRGAAQWYLWWGNDVISREGHGFAAMLAPASGTLAHRVGSALASLPAIVAVPSPDSEGALQAVASLRSRVRLAGWAALVLAALLAAQYGARLLSGGR